MPEPSPFGDKVHWLPQDVYDKLVGQYRLQLNGIFSPFRSYGMDVLIPQSIEEVVKLTEAFGLRVRGIDKIVSLEYIQAKARQERSNRPIE